MGDLDKNCYCTKTQNTFEVKSYTKLNPELRLELKRITKLLIKPQKGFLDLSIPSENSNEPRNDLKFLNGFSDILSSDELSEYITAVIVDWNTSSAEISTGCWKLPKVMAQKSIVTGVKIDQGTVPLFGTYNEMVTQGLDDLHSKYASVTQSTGMIPIVHLEIINLPKATYSIIRALEAHQEILSNFFSAFNQYHVALESIILMLAIIEPGIDNAAYHDPCTLADYTSTLLNQLLPPAIPAIILSATNQQFSNYLNALTQDKDLKSWKLLFHCLKAPRNSSKNISDDTLMLLEDLHNFFHAHLNIKHKNSLSWD
ncbi:Similar to aldob: Fructose-bisphosphate aldolase B (Sparus aurata) [Cotesia congregata]|uniref:fructose-bisphosphate aldolase n=1 Tax=Cotesia congregata TaxID=51543 RepID=A0A8J2E6Q1_COTCN|nr:Similar to aldob: Fructose-bisphosphate aldolase B (Sparus aurata) [Cotesia congregata]